MENQDNHSYDDIINLPNPSAAIFCQLKCLLNCPSRHGASSDSMK